MNNEQISDIVAGLLEKFSIKRAPVPVDAIAKGLGIEITELPGDDEISGAMIRTEDRTIIAVNPAHHSNRQRFTIAHELGHYHLHQGLERHVAQNFRIAWRNADSSKAINWTEIQANRFAAELLMPTEFLERDLNALQTVEYLSVALLVSKYKVSPEAMKIRLSQLGILGPF